MASNAGIPLHGFLDPAHVSTANSQYAPNNIPTPWPLVFFSTLFSLIICCVAAVPAFISVGDTRTVLPLNPAQPAVIPLSTSSPGDKQVNIELQPKGKRVSLKLPKVAWKFSMLWLSYYLTVVYCTFRAVSALYLFIKIRLYNTSPLPAPSTILVALISTQIVHANFNHHPITRLILWLDILALSISFGFCSYLLGPKGWSRYGTLAIADGNCPVPSADCRKQAVSWLSVGCDKWTTQPWFYVPVSPGRAQQYGIPYVNGGSVNDINALKNTEQGVIIIGTIWFIFAFLQLWDIYNILDDIFSSDTEPVPVITQSSSVVTSLQAMLARLLPRRVFIPRKSRVRNDFQRSVYYWNIGCGIFITLLVACMAIGGHAYQMRHKQKVEYLDCFGPVVGTNLTLNSHGVVVGTQYLGNATSWCDCFEIRAPGSKNGFWSDWVAQNTRSGSLYRIAGGF